VSWEPDTGPVRRDPASSGVVVVRHGGQVGLRGDGQLSTGRILRGWLLEYEFLPQSIEPERQFDCGLPQRD
jgi:hypothetical protein